MNEQFYRIVLVVAIIVAAFFCLLVFATGKGDAMGGGTSGIRTTFRGRATFDDQISKVTLICGMAFMALMLVLDVIATRVFRG